MNRNRRNSLSALFLLVVAVFVGGCSQETPEILANGTLRLSIGHVAQKVESRATPSQLGKPLAAMFNLKIQRSGSQTCCYDGKFVEELSVNIGTYDITAYYGENVILGKDAPYYEGVATALIEEGVSTSVSIPCRVANALISVSFGRDEEERARFDKFYTNYGFMVRIANHSLAITNEDKGASIYFPAGSSPTLVFFGTLRENDKVVSCEMTSDAIPEVFAAADHAMITLTLPDPESAMDVDISKVEVETVTIEETIPLSWLPVPVATAEHTYDAAGNLVGTDVNLSSSYPGIQWRTVLTNASDEAVRVIEGMGELQLSYDKSPEYPYLPSGDYKAVYYAMQGEIAKEISSCEFCVGKPELKVTVDGYSSYTKYLEGDIDGANACDGNSVYDISVALNVSEALLSKYTNSITFKFDSFDAESVVAGKNKFVRTEPYANQAARFEPYRLTGNATFDGVSVSSYKDFYITGLPVTFAPPTVASGWANGSNATFSSGEVKIGGNSGNITYKGFAIPAGVPVTLGYKYKLRAGATLLSTNKFTVTAENLEVFSQSLRGNLLSAKEETYEGVKAFTPTTQTTTIKCVNNSSSGASTIYYFTFKYSN